MYASALNLVCGVMRPGLGKYLTALDVFTLDAAQQCADVVACTTFIQQFPEHLNAGDGGLGGRFHPDDLDLFANLDDAALDTTGGNRTTTGDGEDVFDRHQERLVDCALRHRDVAVDGIHQLEDRLLAQFALFAFERLAVRFP